MIFHTFSMALYHKWDVKNDFAYVLTFVSLISDSLGSVCSIVSNYFVYKGKVVFNLYLLAS